MEITRYPLPYQSMFRPACFTLEDMRAAGGIDIEISSVGMYGPLGVKRLYSATSATVNVAPYARRLFAPEPLCSSAAGIYSPAGRHAAVFISGGGIASPSAVLCGGTRDAEWNRLMSASPSRVAIAPGECDELSVISNDWVSPVVTFRRGATTYTDNSMGRGGSQGVMTAVVDAGAVIQRYRTLTGGTAAELTGFTVRMRLDQTGFADRVLERHYTIDRTPRTGQRLAWVNSYGAIDYYTFPAAAEFRSAGSRNRIGTSAGFRTVSTSAFRSLKLLSEPVDAAGAEWLSELFSSPAVWMVSGADFEKVEVAAGGVAVSPLEPTVVEVVVSPGVEAFSRKL
jgi:hypothetical protein